MAVQLNGYIICYTFFLKLISVESRMIPELSETMTPDEPGSDTYHNPYDIDEMESTRGLIPKSEFIYDSSNSQQDPGIERDEDNFVSLTNIKCAILVMSNQNHEGGRKFKRSLLRKYRYDQKGNPIPGSVKYFNKYSEDEGTAIIVPLKNTISPSDTVPRYKEEDIPLLPYTYTSQDRDYYLTRK